MKYIDFINGLSEIEQDTYASNCGTTGKYLRIHIKHARKVPRPQLLKKLHEETSGLVSELEVLEHFKLINQ